MGIKRKAKINNPWMLKRTKANSWNEEQLSAKENPTAKNSWSVAERQNQQNTAES